jgi:hypothetical protein
MRPIEDKFKKFFRVRQIKREFQMRYVFIKTHIAIQSCFLCGKSQVHISIRRLSIFTEIFVDFLSSFRHIPVLYLKLGHDCFFPH